MERPCRTGRLPARRQASTAHVADSSLFSLYCGMVIRLQVDTEREFMARRRRKKKKDDSESTAQGRRFLYAVVAIMALLVIGVIVVRYAYG